LPRHEIEASQVQHERFYAMVHALIEALINRWGCVLLFDIHSYNHRRGSADASAADPAGNPDIDLGVTTLDTVRWGPVLKRFSAALRSTPVEGRELDVRENIRYDDGGHFPEWLYATFGEKVCTITLEYKKFFMDEWTAQIDIGKLDDLRNGLERAAGEVRGDFLACR
jgi:hypothetical protein